MKMQFTLKVGKKIIEGRPGVDTGALTLKDVTTGVQEAEALLGKLLGAEVTIEQVG